MDASLRIRFPQPEISEVIPDAPIGPAIFWSAATTPVPDRYWLRWLSTAQNALNNRSGVQRVTSST